MWLLRRPNYQRASLKCQGFVLLLLYFCCFWWRKRMWSEKNNFYIKEPKWCCSKPPSVFLTGLIITHPLFAYFHVFTQMLSSQIAVIKQVPVAVPIFCLPFSMIIFCWNDKMQCFLRWWATECARHPTTLAGLIQSYWSLRSIAPQYLCKCLVSHLCAWTAKVTLLQWMTHSICIFLHLSVPSCSFCKNGCFLPALPCKSQCSDVTTQLWASGSRVRS